MPVDLLSYRGDANLGLGSNPNIGPATNPDLSVINDTAKTLMLLDNQKNMMLYNQKIRERDELNQMIATDQVAVGDILPEYQPIFDEAKKKTEDTFFKWKGNFNDTKGFQEYKASLQELKDVSTKAQSKTVQLKRLEQEKAQKKLPRDIEDMDKWIKQEKDKDFWDEVTPYQNLHDFSMDDILDGVKQFKTSHDDPTDPFGSYDESHVDYDDVLDFKRNQFLHDREAADSIDQFYTKMQQMNTPELMKTVDALNARLVEYNNARGLVQGQKGYAPPIKKSVIDVDGEDRLVIEDPKMDFAAKYALANQETFNTRTPRFNKNVADLNKDKAKAELEGKKLGISQQKADAYGRLVDHKIKEALDKNETEDVDVRDQYLDFVNNMVLHGIDITDKKTGKVEGSESSVFMDELPGSYQFINGPVVDSKGNIKAGQLTPFQTTNTKGPKRPYYFVKFVTKDTGEKLTKDSPIITNTYNKWRSENNYPGTKEDVLKSLLRDGAIEMILKGKNGSANYSSMYSAAKALNAKAKPAKNQEPVPNAPLDFPDTENDQ